MVAGKPGVPISGKGKDAELLFPCPANGRDNLRAETGARLARARSSPRTPVGQQGV